MILNKEELNTNWNIQASMVEEFIEKGIIKPELKELFLKNYKKLLLNLLFLCHNKLGILNVINSIRFKENGITHYFLLKIIFDFTSLQGM